jgi:predicted nucleic acid-binding protein
LKGWLLDTNVIAELAGRKCEPRVVAWLEAQPEESLFISVLNLAEYDKGAHNLDPASPLRASVVASLAALETRFRARTLPLTNAIVRRWGAISGDVLRTTGRRVPVIDALFAATAVVHGLYFVTRNVRDVAGTGAAVFNPWQDDPGEYPLLQGE